MRAQIYVEKFAGCLVWTQLESAEADRKQKTKNNYLTME